MLPLVLPEAVVSQLFAELYATEGYSLTVDLNAQQVITPAVSGLLLRWMLFVNIVCCMGWMILGLRCRTLI